MKNKWNLTLDKPVYDYGEEVDMIMNTNNALFINHQQNILVR